MDLRGSLGTGSMQRRSFIQSALAAIALIGFPVMAKTDTRVAQHEKLEKLRDYLMPGVWAIFSDTGLDYKIDIRHGGLLVIAWLPGHEQLAFAITEKAIAVNQYLGVFCPSLISLRNELLNRHGMASYFIEKYPNRNWGLSDGAVS